MPEILTESFCERCGTRYTFESARQRVRLKRVKVLTKGVKNFVLSDSTSMDEAMASARAETDREVTTNQLDAFHQTFTFCMSCRQYTCSNCWNRVEARCLSCAPLVAAEAVPAGGAAAVLATLDVAQPIPVQSTNGSNGHDAAAAAVVVADAQGDAVSQAQAEGGPAAADIELAAGAELAAVAPDASAGDAAAEPAAVAAAPEVVAEPAAAPKAVAERAAVAAEPEAVAEPAAHTEVVPEPAPEAQVARAIAAVAQGESTPAPASDPQPGAAAPTGEASPPTPVDIAAQDLQSHDAGIAAAASVLATGAVVHARNTADVGKRTASQTTSLLRRFRPGQNIDAELEAYERERAAALTAASIVSAAPVPAVMEPTAVGQAPAPAAAEAQAPATAPTEPTSTPDATTTPATEPITPAMPAAAASTKPKPAPQPRIEDLVVQPTWQRVAPDTGEEQPPVTPSIPVAASAVDGDAPKWPSKPEWPTSTRSTGLPFLGRPAVPDGGFDGIWAASAREVITTPRVPGKPANVVQPCVSCGLSLSANARFCRRCGAAQS